MCAPPPPPPPPPPPHVPATYVCPSPSLSPSCASYICVPLPLPFPLPFSLPQDIDEENCRKFPKIYTLGQQNKEFNYYLFFLTLVKGILTSGAIFFVLFALLINNVHPGTGFELDYESFQFMTAAALTIVVNVEVGEHGCGG